MLTEEGRSTPCLRRRDDPPYRLIRARNVRKASDWDRKGPLIELRARFIPLLARRALMMTASSARLHSHDPQARFRGLLPLRPVGRRATLRPVVAQSTDGMA